jgi:carboxymethylenebutenolidase
MRAAVLCNRGARLMAVVARWQTGPGGMPIYRARPAHLATPLPAVVVIQEVWGVDAHIRDVTRRMAAAGYLAIAPELYAPDGRRPAALAADRVAEVRRIVDRVAGVDWHDPAARAAGADRLDPARREDLMETLDHVLPATRDLRRLGEAVAASATWAAIDAEADGRVAAVGFCLGGALVADLAEHDVPLHAGVVFYGYMPSGPRSRPGPPLLGLFGADDPHVIETIAPFRRAVADAGGRLELTVYPDTPHAFFNDDRPGYRPGPARHAWASALSFLAAELP